MRDISGKVDDASLGQFPLIIAAPHQRGALDHQEHLVLESMQVVGRGNAFTELKPADGQVALSGRTIEQQGKGRVVEPCELLLLLRLRYVCHAHGSAPGTGRRPVPGRSSYLPA